MVVSDIGRLNETEVHEQLKHLYCKKGGKLEVEIDGFVVDVRNSDEIVEIQTRSLIKLRRKIESLSQTHTLRIVHPIFARTTIIKYDGFGKLVSRRASPKRGRVEQIFRELVYVADLLPNPNVILDVPFLTVEEYRRDDGRGSWRRRGVSIAGRRLVEVGETLLFRTASDFLKVIPESTPDRFTHKELADAVGLRVRDVQPITNSLRRMGLLTVAEISGREYVFGRG